MFFEHVYIHIPFCSKKCDYCSFFSVPNPDKNLVDAYLNRLEEDLKEANLSIPVRTVYLGGGTPSLLSCLQLERFYAMIKKHVPLIPAAEISMECNPETLSPEKGDIILSFANRLSIGVQSFDQKLRSKLGRKSKDSDIESTLNSLKNRQVKNLNLDLIYGIPGQSLNAWEQDLKIAAEHDISHLSCYCLTIEEGTALATAFKDENLVDDEVTAEMWTLTGAFLESRKMSRYEISNYARPGAECAHNLNVWYGQPYLGLGPAATSFDGKDRWTQPSSLEKWLHGQAPEWDIIDPEYRMAEIFIIGLRTVEGWSHNRWRDVFLQKIMYVDWNTMLERAFKVKAIHPDLMKVSEDNISLTEKGLLFWNSAAEAWLE
jgi:oxygen-independent coproporphyrinogen-3 oxidase